MNFKDCGCNSNGTKYTSTQSTALKCDVITAKCDCKIEYTGDKCNQCASGYFNDGSSSTNPVCNSEL